MTDKLAEFVENEKFNEAIAYCLYNENDEYSVITQKRVINYCLKQGASKQIISDVVAEFLRKKDFKKAEPFMDYVNPNTLLVESVESNWADGINYALKRGADNFTFAIYKAIQTENYNLAEFLNYKQKKVMEKT